MFRNKFLLRRSDQLESSAGEESRPSRSADLILLAESDAREQQLLGDFLEEKGFRILKARDGDAAFDLAIRHRPSLVLCAFDLPLIDGYKLSQMLREHQVTQSIPFVLICPAGKLPDKVIGHQTYVSDYIRRPISLSELTARLSAVLRRETSLHRAGTELAPEEPPPSRPPESKAAGRRRPRSARGKTQPFAAPPEPAPAAGPQPAGFDDILAEFKQKSVRRAAESVPLPDEPATMAGDKPVAFAPAEQPLIKAAQAYDGLYGQAAEFVAACLRQAEAGATIEIERGEEISRKIAESIQLEVILLRAATDRGVKFSVPSHCVNVAIIATKIGIMLGYSLENAARLALVGLVHDVGTARFADKHLLYKPAVYTKAELEEVRRCPVYSVELLAPLGNAYQWLVQVVSQVYERESGQGYPRGLAGPEIREEAKILGIAGFFESRIHDRPHRKAVTGYQALEELTTSEADLFSDKIVKALIRGFSVYPYNEYVILNTGEIGKVVDINKDNALRPIVEILFDSHGEGVVEPKVTNLVKNPSLFIERAITRDELPAEPRA